MDVPTLRRLDRWLGVPACFLLTLWRRAFHRRTPPVGPARRLVFVKLAEQGSTVLAHWALADAARRCGRENVYCVVFDQNRFILDAMDAVPPDNVLTLPSRGFVPLAIGGLRLLRKLRALRVDAAVDLEFFARSSALLTFLSGAPVRVGFHRHAREAAYRGDLMTHRLSFNPQLHTSDTFLAAVHALDHDPALLPAMPAPAPSTSSPLPRVRPTPRDRDSIHDKLKERGLADARPRFLLNANCSDLLPLRRWPADRYVELAHRLLARHPGAAVLFTGAPDEEAACAALAERVGSRRCASLAGRTTLAELLALYDACDVLVTNDSGPAHFAALTPVRVVVLFGPETPALFGVRSPRSRALWAGLACSPCVNAFNDRFSRCRHNACLHAISVDAVAEAVEQILQKHPPSHEDA